MKRNIVLFTVVVFTIFYSLITPNLCYCKRLPETIIRVGVLIGVKSFNISCEGKYYVYDVNTGQQTSIEPMNDYIVKPVSKGISIEGNKFGSSVRLVAQENGSFLRINGRRYRDTIIVNSAGGKCTVINELGLEDYLNGILPSEVNAAWSPETLKAQAVISRTYVLRNLRKHEKDGFDVCMETHCQVYGGVEAEDPRTNAAVEASRSEVLVYKGELAQSLFHASCGGHTENPNCVWTWDSSAPEYLKGVKDKYCADSPHNYWKNTVNAETIKNRLVRSGYNVGSVKKIKTSGHDNSGRPEKLKIISSEGTLVITPAKFRMAIDPWIIKSAFITNISKSGKGFIFEGKGWGHGVGLCQWGAKVMGDKGYDYKQILELYYPGTDVEKWEE